MNNKNKIARVVLPKSSLIYGKQYGVTQSEAMKAYEKGFMQNVMKKKNTKYRGYTGVKFIWR